MVSQQDAQALRPAAGEMLTISVANEIQRVKESPEWNAGDRHSVSLIKNSPLSVLLIVLRQGAKLHEHRTRGPFALQVVSGAIRFNARTERLISAGEIVSLDRDIPHSLEALEDSAILLITAID